MHDVGSPGDMSILGETFTRLRVGAVLAVALAAAFIGWLLLKDGDGNGEPRAGASPRAAARAATVRDLEALPAAVGHKVYWAGERPGYTYELTQTSDGSIYVRYLPTGVELGSDLPDFTTVGTYPHRNAFATVRKLSRRRGALVREIDDGGLAAAKPARPSSVYLAYPKTALLIEVFDPSPERALRLVTSGRVRAIR
jgi:hypothetical protein